MSKKINPKLSGVSETLLLPLYVRAKEMRRPDPMLRDEEAPRIMERIDYDFSKLKLRAHDEVAVLMRAREFDRQVRSFLGLHHEGVVVHIGCGLDTRFTRVDNGEAEWYDLDLPPVIDLRRKLIEVPCERYHLLATSVLDEAWLAEIGLHRPRPFLFIAEGVLPYFEEEQVKSLMLRLRDRFPGAEFLLDAMTPFMIWGDNLHLALTGINARLHWGSKRPKDLEEWGDRICLLKEWYYSDTPEPRLGAFQWVFNRIGKSIGIFRYRLG